MKLKTTISAILSVVMMVSAQAGTDYKEMKMSPELRPTDAGYYVGIYGGANLAQNYNTHTSIDPTATSFPSVGTFKQGGSTSGDVGAVGGLKGGYNFESYQIDGDFMLQPAVEAEVFYLGSKAKTTFSYTGTPASTITETRNMDSVAFMLNGLIRFKTGSIFTPYLGAGIGAEYTQASNATLTSGTGSTNGGNNHVNADNVSPAVQGLIGCDIEVFKNWDLFTEYSYLVAINPQFSSVNFSGLDPIGGNDNSYTFKSDYMGQHLINAGVKYNF